AAVDVDQRITGTVPSEVTSACSSGCGESLLFSRIVQHVGQRVGPGVDVTDRYEPTPIANDPWQRRRVGRDQRRSGSPRLEGRCTEALESARNGHDGRQLVETMKIGPGDTAGSANGRTDAGGPDDPSDLGLG